VLDRLSQSAISRGRFWATGCKEPV
jgi:hypothetical protein